MKIGDLHNINTAIFVFDSGIAVFFLMSEIEKIFKLLLSSLFELYLKLVLEKPG